MHRLHRSVIVVAVYRCLSSLCNPMQVRWHSTMCGFRFFFSCSFVSVPLPVFIIDYFYCKCHFCFMRWNREASKDTYPLLFYAHVSASRIVLVCTVPDTMICVNCKCRNRGRTDPNIDTDTVSYHSNEYGDILFGKQSASDT